MTTRDTFVYRAYGANGELLYVGITNNPTRRYREHRAWGQWTGQIARVRMAGPYPRPVAARLEREAQINEDPAYGDTPARRSARGRETAALNRRFSELIAEGHSPAEALAMGISQLERAA